MTKDPPYGAKVTLKGGHTGSGWSQKDIDPWLDKAIKDSGKDFFGKESGSFGMGGSIPFLNELGKKFPEA